MFEKMKHVLKSKVVALGAGVSVATAWVAQKVSAAPLIANDTLQGLPSLGTDMGDFLGNLAPGVFKFILLMALATGIVLIFVAIFTGIKKSIGGGMRVR